ncbi:hypothetical protein DFJ73DRAFT_830049 [Zopfochytrium polystomum]|nr:hypothetical protein DFJ73DRAFT_830049 [Zopfochytrium polystomum]
MEDPQKQRSIMRWVVRWLACLLACLGWSGSGFPVARPSTKHNSITIKKRFVVNSTFDPWPKRRFCRRRSTASRSMRTRKSSRTSSRHRSRRFRRRPPSSARKSPSRSARCRGCSSRGWTACCGSASSGRFCSR